MSISLRERKKEQQTFGTISTHTDTAAGCLQPGCASCLPTNSVSALKETWSTNANQAHHSLHLVLSYFTSSLSKWKVHHLCWLSNTTAY